MIILNDIVKNSIFSSIGTLLSKNDVLIFKQYINFNKLFIQKFPMVIYAFNGDNEAIDLAAEFLTDTIDTDVHIIKTENLGHTFGTFLLDNVVFEYASQHPKYQYIWKFSNDVIVESPILDLSVNISDFYYINNIGYISLDLINEPERPKYSKESLCQAVIEKSYFYPQTNYYIIKNNSIFYPDKEIIYQLKSKYDDIRLSNPSIHPWHAIYECDSENMLKKTVVNNNLSTCHLLSSDSTKKIIEYVSLTKNYDGSHKNVLYTQLGNLCHLQYPQHPVYAI